MLQAEQLNPKGFVFGAIIDDFGCPFHKKQHQTRNAFDLDEHHK